MLREISLSKYFCITLMIIVYKFENDRDLYYCLHTRKRKRRRKRKKKEKLILKLIISLYIKIKEKIK